jgi:hypothetical protein
MPRLCTGAMLILIYFSVMLSTVTFLMRAICGLVGANDGNAAEAKGLPTNSLPKHGGAKDNKFLVTHPMTDVA